MTRTGFRAVLYSPEAAGSGQFRRSLLLARRFAGTYPDGRFLVLTDAREAGSVGFPDTVDCISLPSLHEHPDPPAPGRVSAELSEVQQLRASVLEAALLRCAPDVVLVNHTPTGVLGELRPVLARLRAEFGTRLVLGLRDILEEPALVRCEWERDGHADAIRELYDAVWIFGDEWIYDPVAEYALPADIAARTEYTGYLNPAHESEGAALENADCLATQLFQQERVVLCRLGGDDDGVQLAEAFLAADLPPGMTGVLVTKPFMASAVRERLVAQVAARHGRFHVLSMVAEPVRLLAHAERVITTGSYDSITESVALRKQTLVVPLALPRHEQLIRSQRFDEFGLVDMLHPDHLSPAALSAWLQRTHRPAQFARRALDMGGLDRAVDYLDVVLAGRWNEPDARGRRAWRDGGLAIA